MVVPDQHWGIEVYILELGAVQKGRPGKGRAVVAGVGEVHLGLSDAVHEGHGDDVVRRVGAVDRKALLRLLRTGGVLSCFRVLVGVSPRVIS